MTTFRNDGNNLRNSADRIEFVEVPEPSIDRSYPDEIVTQDLTGPSGNTLFDLLTVVSTDPRMIGENNEYLLGIGQEADEETGG